NCDEPKPDFAFETGEQKIKRGSRASQFATATETPTVTIRARDSAPSIRIIRRRGRRKFPSRASQIVVRPAIPTVTNRSLILRLRLGSRRRR
ncbi:hypothetical protein PMAYCL1PPCAC_14422, partial [Pristionchus mayeri]